MGHCDVDSDTEWQPSFVVDRFASDDAPHLRHYRSIGYCHFVILIRLLRPSSLNCRGERSLVPFIRETVASVVVVVAVRCAAECDDVASHLSRSGRMQCCSQLHCSSAASVN